MKRLFFITFISCLLFSQFRVVEAYRTSTSPEIDALMESVWEGTDSYTDFVMHDPTPLGTPTEKTSFRFMYDDENIYFYVKSYGDPSDIVTVEGKRDDAAFAGDWILISISPLNDKNTGYSFLVNPANVQGDARLHNNGWEDWNWDAIWYSEAQVDEDGWSLEVRIPLRAIKFQAEDIQDWGFNMTRFMRKKNEKVFWEKIIPDIGYKISHFAQIRGIEGIKSQREIQVIPSAVSAFNSEIDYDPTLSNRNVGVDVKFNLNETHSVLATLKPDFAQIEADADQINLSDYPLFLNEKRPFFLRGSDLYNMPDEVFYSRRMASPDVGAKFFGGIGNLQYGLTYVYNDMASQNVTTQDIRDNSGAVTGIDTLEQTHKHKEHFLLTRVSYNEPQKFQIGYLNGLVKSDYELSGMLHAFDAKYYPQDNLRFTLLAATTVLDGEDFADNELERYTFYGASLNDMKARGNSSLRFQMDYNTDTWYSYFRLQKKTNYFQQALVGFPEPNNRTEQNFNLGRKWRFKNSDFRQFRANINVNHTGTYDNRVQSFNYNFNLHANFQFKEMGYVGGGTGLNFNDGQFRYYNVPDGVTTRHFDNYGSFIGADNHGISWWMYIENDFSKTHAVNINPYIGRSRGYDEAGFSILYQWRASSALKLRTSFDYQTIENSKYYDWNGIYRSYSGRVEYSATSEIFLKYIIQFNPQSDRLSNNLIATYEYERGSFFYLAYAETGVFDDNYKKGSIIENYDLSNRTISLKWTYALFL